MELNKLVKMPFKDYRAQTQFLSVTELKSFAQSPYYYKRRYLDKADVEEKRKAQFFGTLCHTLLLEPFTFEAEYYVSDVRKDSRTKAYADVLEAAGNKMIVSSADVERAKECVKETQLRLGDDMVGGKAEESILYDGPAFPVPVKGRFDFIAKNGEIVDYKTTENPVDNDTVTRDIMRWNYHIQAAFYQDLYAAINGGLLRPFKWVFQQTIFPFACQVYMPSEEVLEIGRLEYQAEMRNLMDAKRLDYWPRIVAQDPIISFPAWRLARLQQAKEVKLGKQGEITNGIHPG